MKKIISAILLLTTVVLCLASCDRYGEGACAYAQTRDISERDIVYVEMKVEGYDKVLILLDRTTAPVTVDNFVKLVNMGFYDGLTFHRLKSSFMIQGGCPNGNGTGNSGETITGEFTNNGHYNDISHIKGVISMGRSPYSYDSASCQFFITNTDYPYLDGDYASFGYVVKGLDVIDEITSDYAGYASPAANYTISDRNKQPVIKYIKVVEGEE